MGNEQVNADTLSGRQLSVAVLVSGLSPAAALAGRGQWAWMVLWAGMGIILGWLVLCRLKRRPLYQGVGGGLLAVLYGGWAVVLAARVLRRAAERVEFASGGEHTQLWLILLLTLPLVWMGWGKAAPFFRAAEIFWLAMALVLALVIVFGLARVEWRNLASPVGTWWSSAMVMAETMAPALFVLPYLYKAEGPNEGKRGLVWLAGLGAASVALSVITTGLLDGAVAWVEQPFFAAAGLLGNSARCEGLLSALWLLPDLTLAGLLCRVWGPRRWPALAAVLAGALALTGATGLIADSVYVYGTLILLGLTMLFPKGKGKIVVHF